MSTLARTYTDTADRSTTINLGERTGGPRGTRSTIANYSFFDRFGARSASGSHMPLDTKIHWELSNPLNIIPATLLLLTLVAIVALIIG